MRASIGVHSQPPLLKLLTRSRGRLRGRSGLRIKTFEQELAAVQVHRDPERREELVTNDAAELEAQEDARRAEVQDNEREIPVLDFIEVQILPRHEERVA